MLFFSTYKNSEFRALTSLFCVKFLSFFINFYDFDTKSRERHVKTGFVRQVFPTISLDILFLLQALMIFLMIF